MLAAEWAGRCRRPGFGRGGERAADVDGVGVEAHDAINRNVIHGSLAAVVQLGMARHRAVTTGDRAEREGAQGSARLEVAGAGVQGVDETSEKMAGSEDGDDVAGYEKKDRREVKDEDG